MKPTRTLKFAVVRWLARGFLGGIALMLGSACSSTPEDCTPPIAPGTRFKVQVIEETAASSKCHITTLQKEFEIVAAQDDGSRPASRCMLTPAMWAPTQQQGITVVTCKPSTSQMLGTNCEMQYPSTCKGLVSFYFWEPMGVQVDWGAPVIQNATFRIEDTTLGCFPNISQCLDEYKVVLTRV